MSNRPVISIGMPVFNAERTIALAISSILQQDYSNWELLIVDDGSTDSTLQIAKSFNDSRIRVVSHTSNKRLPARLNEAVTLSRGDYFARMDGDDISYPNRLGRQLAYLEAHPETDVVGGSIGIFKGDGELLGWRPARETHEEICGGLIHTVSLAHVTWMGKIQWFRENPYDPTKFLGQDCDLLIRTRRHSHFGAVPIVVVGVREERIALRKILRGRRAVAKTLVADAFKNRDVRPAITAVFEVAKFALDATACGTGLRYRLLRHRARPITPSLEREWGDVWAQVGSEAAQQRAASGAFAV